MSPGATGWRAVVAMVVAALLLYGLFRVVDVASVMATATRVPRWRVLAMGAAGACFLLLRAARAAVLLPAGAPHGEVLTSVSVGFLASLVGPAPLGLVVRPALLARRAGVPITTSVAGMVAERALDALALLALLGVAGGGLLGRALVGLEDRAIALGPWVVLVTCIGGLGLLALWRRGALSALTAGLISVRQGLRADPRRGWMAVLLTLVLWVGGPLSSVLVLGVFAEIPAGPGTVAAFWASVMLAGAAVPTPGAVGAFEAAGTAALAAEGVSPVVGLAATGLVHAASLGGQAVIAAFLGVRILRAPPDPAPLAARPPTD